MFKLFKRKRNKQEEVILTSPPPKDDPHAYLKLRDENGKMTWKRLPDSVFTIVEYNPYI
ncbi:MAG: hypothetical protein IAC61_00020 [Firmicutes bacterium]|uniref:Uncharacterized protein n=1 Tax=Candidatus Alloenteromonas pullistercoris TaxID=2840785 RepID=A0A9D9GSK9_9FIRM|nr:hypothetical protein [Candidatus Enteromonas pullistercoris]